MDHISQALERARAERASLRSWVTPDASRPPTAPGELLEASLRPEHLHAHHVLCDSSADDPALADCYRLLRTRVLHALRRENGSVLGITSPNPRAGKTLTAINLAISLAREGTDEVVLVDADLRRPAVADYLGLPVDNGLVDYLAGHAAFDRVLTRVDLDGLLVVPGRPQSDLKDAPELLHSARLSELVHTLRQAVPPRIVIVDLPPASIGDDVLATAPLLDAFLLVIEEGGTHVDELRHTAELLAEFRVLGSVLNRSAEKPKVTDGRYYYSPSSG